MRSTLKKKKEKRIWQREVSRRRKEGRRKRHGWERRRISSISMVEKSCAMYVPVYCSVFFFFVSFSEAVLSRCVCFSPFFCARFPETHPTFVPANIVCASFFPFFFFCSVIGRPFFFLRRRTSKQKRKHRSKAFWFTACSTVLLLLPKSPLFLSRGSTRCAHRRLCAA